MKKITQLLAFFAISTSLVLFQGCKEDEKIEPAPTVDVDPTAAAGGERAVMNLLRQCYDLHGLLINKKICRLGATDLHFEVYLTSRSCLTSRTTPEKTAFRFCIAE